MIYLPQIMLSDLLLSPSSYNDINNVFNIDTKIIPSGINTKIFSYGSKSRTNNIIYAGRLAPEKNLFRLLDLFKLIQHKYILNIVGDGPIKEELQKYAVNKQIKNVIFIGALNQKDLANYYQKAKAFLTTSLTETFGLTNLEALSCGTPIIYPHCETFDSFYKKDFNETAFTIDNNQEFLLAIKYIENNNLNKKCRKYAEKYDWYNATKKLIKIYDKVLQK